MASSDKIEGDYAKEAPSNPPTTTTAYSCFKLDVVLRGLLFASTLTAVIVLVTSKQTVTGLSPVPLVAKFTHSPAFVYFLAALSVAGLYSLVTALASISVILKPQYSTKFLLHFILGDVLVLGIMASATGTAGGVGYIGLKGNTHVMWPKICSVFDTFCKHIGGAIAVSLFGSVLLVLLVLINITSLHKRIPK